MTGIPFIPRSTRARGMDFASHWGVEDLLDIGQAFDIQPPGYGDTDPIIPSRARNRALTLNEIGDAGVVANPRPTLRANVVGALRGIAAAQPFDPSSESFGDAFLGTALNAFSGVTGEREGRAREAEAEDDAIVAQEMARRRQARQDALAESLTAARVGAYDALAAERYAEALRIAGGLDDEEEPETIDVGALAQAWANAGRPEIADFIRKNPDIVRRSPSSFLRPSQAPRSTPEEVAAAERADRADLEAGREILRRGNDPVTAVPPTAVDSVLGALRRLVDPTYAADSIVREQVRGGRATPDAGRRLPPPVPEDDLPDLDAVLGLDAMATDPLVETVRGFQDRAGGGPTRVVPSRRGRAVPQRRTSGGQAPGAEPRLGGSEATELQDVARQFDPRTLPISRAHGALTHRTVQPPFAKEELRRILDLAGYEDDDIDEILRDRSR